MKPTGVAPVVAVLGLVSLVSGCSGSGEEGPCSPNPCRESGRTRCEMDGTVGRCVCDTGLVEVNGVCINNAACTPNPCTAPYQTTCVPQGTTTEICVCDPGHAPAGGACDPFPIFDCSVVHTTGSPDAFEPDECPTHASDVPIVPIWTDGHTLNPTGDVDWFRIQGSTDHIYELRATSDDVELYADAYATDGVTPLGADHRGAKSIAVWFKAPSDAPLYARIQALRGNATGPYQIQVTDLGKDDFADITATALSMAANTSITGELQFDADRDVLKLPLQGGIAYSVTFEFFGVGTPLFELVAEDGITVRQKLSGAKVGTVVRSSGTGAVFLRASGLTPNTLGAFSFTSATLGADDHGDTLADATPIVSDGSPIAVSMDRTTDVDVMSFDAVAPNIYAFSCTPTSGGGYVYVTYTLTDESGAVLAQQASGYNAYFAHETSETGKRFVHVRNDSSPFLAKLSCKLEKLGVDDHGDTFLDATPITAGAGLSPGNLETAGDKDVFSFTAVAGHVYRFQCSMPNYGSCYVRLLSSNGAVLTSGSSVAWEVSSAGTYYVEVGASYSSEAASYTFALDDLGADDHGDTFATATALSVGVLPSAAALEEPLDKDVFSFQALAQHIYRFTCTTSTSSGCVLKVFGASGALLAQSVEYGSSNAWVAYEVLVAGTYYVEVSIGSTYGALAVSYSYRLEDLGIDDHGDDVLTATPVSVGDSGTANLEFAGDVDTFKFTPTTGRVYRLGCTRGTLTSCELRLKDPIGQTLYSVSTTANGQILFEATSANPVVFTVGESNYSFSKPQGTYTWSIADIGTDDHGDTLGAATSALLPMTTKNAQLESFGDVDVFGFSATAGHIYRLTCTKGTLPNCGIRAKDSAGNIIAEESGWVSNAAVVATENDTYYFEIWSGSWYDAVVGTYSWLIEDLGLDDHGDTVASATGIASGKPATAGNIQFRGDVDVFSFDATAGHIYVASCTTSTGYACNVTFKNASGISLTSGYNQASYETSTGGTLFVEIRAYNSVDVGAYSIAVEDMGIDDHGDSFATATAIPGLGRSVQGAIQLSGDADYFSISLAANTTYSASALGNYLDVGVYSTNGSFVAVGSSPQTFTTTTAGTYYVRVSSWYYPGSKISYTVEVR